MGDEEREAETFNMTSATNHSTWENWTADEDEDGHPGEHEHGGEEGHDGDHEQSGGDEDDERCMCGSVPGHWKFIGGHGRDTDRVGEDDIKEHENGHHDNKDVDIGLAVVLI